MAAKDRILTYSENIGKKIGLDLPYYLKSSFWVFAFQGIRILSALILSIIFARYASKEVFGNYSYILSILAILSIVSIPGLNLSMLRSIAKGYDGVYKKGVRLSFFWSLLGIPCLLLVGGYYYFFNVRIIGIGLLLSAIVFPFYYAPGFWAILLQAKQKFFRFAQYSGVKQVVSTVIIIGAILISKGNLLIILACYLLTWTFFNLYYYFKCLRNVKNNRADKNWKITGYRVSMISFISYIYDYLDKIIIGLFFGPIPLAIYSIAVSITIQLRTLVKEGFKVVWPKIYRMKEQSIRKNIKRLVILVFASSLVCSVIIILIIPYLLPLLFSDKYLPSVPFAQVYVMTIPLFSLMALLEVFSYGLDMEKKVIKTRYVASAVNVILYLVLIPTMGLIGAIISSLVYYIINDIMLAHYLKKSI